MYEPDDMPLAQEAEDERRLRRWSLATLLLMLAMRALVAGHALLSADEAYYWHWTRPLQLSYLDHPAMVAYWIWAGIHLAGETAFGVRLPSLVGSLVTSALVWDTARLAFRSRNAGWQAMLWLNCTLLFGSAAVIITPDTPLLLFWMLALWSAVRLMTEPGHVRYFYSLGLALGLGAISKYTMALLLPGLLLTVLAFPAPRRWLRQRHAWIALVVAGLCLTPLLLWNLGNGFASFHKQLNHAFDAGVPHPLHNLAEFLGGQVGLVTPLIFPFAVWGMVWALWAGWRQRRPEWFLLGATSLPILLFFLEHTRGGVVQAHWPGPAYLGGLMAAVGGWRQVGRKRWLTGLFRAAPMVGAAMTLLVYFQAATAALPIPIRIDALKRLGGWDELAQAVSWERHNHPDVFMITQKHELTGPISFYLPDHPPVFLAAGQVRPPYYTAADVAALRGRNALIVTPAKDDGSHDIGRYFEKVTPLRPVDLHWGGHVAETVNFYLAENYRGGALVMGDGMPGAIDAP